MTPELCAETLGERLGLVPFFLVVNRDEQWYCLSVRLQGT